MGRVRGTLVEMRAQAIESASRSKNKWGTLDIAFNPALDIGHNFANAIWPFWNHARSGALLPRTPRRYSTSVPCLEYGDTSFQASENIASISLADSAYDPPYLPEPVGDRNANMSRISPFARLSVMWDSPRAASATESKTTILTHPFVVHVCSLAASSSTSPFE